MRLSLPLLACALSILPALVLVSASALPTAVRSDGTPCELVLEGQVLNVCTEYLTAALDANEPAEGKQPELSPGDGDEDEGESDGSEFISPHMPVRDGRRRAGALGILSAVALTSVVVYFLYTRRTRVRTALASLPALPHSLHVPSLNLKSLPHISFPTLSTTRRTRRRARTRGGSKGFRPHASRLRAWATEEGVLDDAYESGLFADTESFDDDLESAGLDLGADEDFMIGAPRRIASFGNKNKVLFTVGDIDNVLETDEALPLAPSPRKFGSGARGYGSAS
ncbi:hypothetical protein M0805_007649 [Coniferiporia weirii]|nr:hypothetical protein M0805_007649 [Coniferiporia weirii]